MKIKCYSIQRSGVNWLMWLLAANYKIKLLNNSSGWTHGPYVENPEVDLNIIISKHPITWLPSMYRYENSTETKTFYLASLSRWNILYSSHLLGMPGNTFYIRYDDLLKDPEDTLKIIETWGIKRISNEFWIAEGYVDEHMNVTEKKFDVNYYLQKDYLDWYEGDLLHMAELLIDWDTAKALGYKKI